MKRNEELQRLKPNSHESTQLFTQIIGVMEESGGRVDRIIYGKLEKLFETNNLEINKREVQPMLKDILTDSNIIIKEKPLLGRNRLNELLNHWSKKTLLKNAMSKR